MVERKHLQSAKLAGALWGISGNHPGLDDNAKTNWCEALVAGITKNPRLLMDALVDADLLLESEGGEVYWVGEWAYGE